MSKQTFNPGLWKPRSVAETLDIYADWATSYDADVTEAGYVTPARVARALAAHLPDRGTQVLDYGCGTGLSGAALAAEGFAQIDGTDISTEMLGVAGTKGIYTTLWQSAPGEAPGTYPAIVATGVVSLGAAPPETLGMLLGCLAPGGLLALSYNDATLADPAYLDAMAAAGSVAELLFEEYGPHLPAKEMGAKVYVLRRR